MTISNEKPDMNKLVYQVNGEEVIFYTVSLNENEIREIVTEITKKYGKIKMRPKYDEHYPEGKEVKDAIWVDVRSDEMFFDRPTEIKNKEVNVRFEEFQKAHEEELVELLITETMAKKETTYPTGSAILLKDGITYDYARTELESLEITSNTVDPSAPIKTNMELANATYRILEYPLLARSLMCVISDLSCIGELELIMGDPECSGIEYYDRILSCINLEPCYTTEMEEFNDVLIGNSNIARLLKGKRISSDSKLYERFQNPDYNEAYKTYTKKMN